MRFQKDMGYFKAGGGYTDRNFLLVEVEISLKWISRHIPEEHRKLRISFQAEWGTTL